MPATACRRCEWVEADAGADVFAEAVQEFALVAADIEDVGPQRDPPPSHSGTPVLQDTVENAHRLFREQGG